MRKAENSFDLGTLCAAVLLVACLAFPAAAPGKSVLIGSPDLSGADGSIECIGTSCYWGGIAQLTLAGPGTFTTAPADGTVTSWRVNGTAAGGGGIFIHVIRRTGPEQYLGLSDSGAAIHTDGTTPNPTSLDVDVGNLISSTVVAYDMPGASAALGTRASPGSNFGGIGILSAGGTYERDPMSTTLDTELLFNATVELEVPRITSLSARQGPLTGGTPVTITGDHLAIATSVRFGETTVPVVSADNESIKVVSPPHPEGGSVDVTVTTAGGSSAASADTKFTYPEPPAPDDKKPPKVTKVKFARGKFVAANIGGPVVSAAKVGSKVTYRLSENATVAATVKRIGKKRRLKKAGKSFSLTAKAGKNSFFFSGRLKNKTLKPGRYKLLLSARDAQGNKSKKPAAARFKVVR